jgi:hypothetical protein
MQGQRVSALIAVLAIFSDTSYYDMLMHSTIAVITRSEATRDLQLLFRVPHTWFVRAGPRVQFMGALQEGPLPLLVLVRPPRHLFRQIQ